MESESIKKTARRAGWLYLSILAIGPFTLMYVPGKLIVPGDAAATAAKIRASESLFRLGIASGLVGDVLFLLVALALYRLLARVDRHHALLMATLAIVSVPITFLNRVNQLAALVLLSGADFLTVFDQRQLEALAMLFLRLYSHGILVVEVFWGLWLLPFGLLVWRSGFLPKILGLLLGIAGLGYALGSLGALVLPAYRDQFAGVMGITALGEMPIIVWLAFWGAKVGRQEPVGA